MTKMMTFRIRKKEKRKLISITAPSLLILTCIILLQLIQQVTPVTYCFGVLSTDPTVCSGRGACTATDTCHCTDPYDTSATCYGKKVPYFMSHVAGVPSNPGAANGAYGTNTLNMPSGVLVDRRDTTGNTVYILDWDNHLMRRLKLDTLIMDTVVGSGVLGATAGTGTAADFGNPHSLVMTNDNNYLIVSSNNLCVIYKIRLSDWYVSIVAGEAGDRGDVDGAFGTSRIDFPYQLTTHPTDNNAIYFGNSGYLNTNRIKKLDLSTNTISTYAGTGTGAIVDGHISVAQFWRPAAILCIDDSTMLVSDYYGGTIRKINMVTQQVTTILGGYAIYYFIMNPYTREIYFSSNGYFYSLQAPSYTTVSAPLIKYSSVYQGSGPTKWTGIMGTTAPAGVFAFNPFTYELIISTHYAHTAHRFYFGCPQGYTDGTSYCTVPICYGFAATDSRVCSNRGTCTAPNTCVCTVHPSDTSPTCNGRTMVPKSVTTIAGVGGSYGTVDGALGTNRLGSLGAWAVHSSETWLVYSQGGSNILRKFDITTGIVTTVAGVAGVNTEVDGIGTAATLGNIGQIAFSKDQDKLLLVTSWYTIRLIRVSNWQVTTIGGFHGGPGNVDGIYPNTRIRTPSMVLASKKHNDIFYFADNGNYVIKAINVATTYVCTVAGSGSSGNVDDYVRSAKINDVQGMLWDDNGDILFVSYTNNYLRKITDLEIITIAGSGSAGTADGPVASATLSSPRFMSIHPYSRDIYIGCFNGNSIRTLSQDQSTIGKLLSYPSFGYTDGVIGTAKFSTAIGETYVMTNGGDTMIVYDAGAPTIRKVVFGCPYGYNGDVCLIWMCSGVNYTSSSVCSSHGTCTGVDTCSCSTGYTGGTCQFPICSGTASNVASVCSNRGLCTAPDTCACNSGYTGSYCQYYLCNSISSANASVCNSRGACGSPNSCTCNTGYTGSDCQYYLCNSISSASASVCNTRGTCTAPNTCSCSTGYTGSDCQYYLCSGVSSANASVCSSHGSCIGVDTCSCSTGYTGSNCQYYLCSGVSSANASVCSSHGACIGVDTCSCSSGYTGPNCQYNLCNGISSANASVCNSRGTCGSPNSCTCNTGYTGSDCQYYLCSGVSSANASVCSSHGTCTGVDTCSCSSGYTGSNCQYNICYGVSSASGTVCSGHGTCTSPDTCSCSTGYTDTTCNIPICNGIAASNSSVCSTHGACTSPDVCGCTSGYGSTDCQYPKCNNILSTNPSVCSGHGTCSSPSNCACQAGYSGSDCEIVRSCYGINFTDANTCSAHGTCDAQDACNCNPNYIYDCSIPVCYGYNASDSSTCSGHGTCATPNNCTCISGWTDLNCSLPICFGKNSSDITVCSGFGSCLLSDNCTCQVGHVSNECQTVVRCNGARFDDANVCSGHGVCSSEDHCICDIQHSGPICNNSICFNVTGDNATVCSGHGVCNFPDNCTCNAGYSGSNCQITRTCFGVEFFNTTGVCSSLGTCTDQNTCICQSGYVGAKCDEIICNGKNSTDSNICSGHGSCIAPENCQCTSGWTGIDCNLAICFGVNASDTGIVCSGGNGTCTAPNVCNCVSGYFGAACQEIICYGGNTTDTASVCSGRGNCISPDVCQCLTGYTGNQCELAICFGYNSSDSANVCHAHGNCSSPDVCDCEAGYVGTSCQLVKCYGKNSSQALEICSGRGTCDAPDLCACSTGYTGLYCELNVCYGLNSSDTSVCSGYGTCVDKDTCTCDTQHSGEKCQYLLCNSIGSNETSTVCHGRGNCTSYNSCTCSTGYGGSDCELFICNHILSSNLNTCSGHGTCTNPNTCACSTGYDGNDCQYAICSGLSGSSSSVCGGHGNCTSADTCNCTIGYAGSNCQLVICSGLQSNDPAVCHGMGNCSSPNQCTCNTGYTGTDCELSICNSINSSDPLVCSGNGNCTAPSVCSCSAGWTGTNCQVPICNGIASNNANVCSGHGNCILTSGTNIQCNCSAGYTGSNCEIPICYGTAGDSFNVCGSTGTCVSANNCSCNTGYSGQQCQDFYCNGVLVTSASVCSGNGNCTSPESCTCSSSWMGSNCDIALCNGIAGNVVTACNGRGTCSIPNNCTCSSGWSGVDCELAICDNILSNAANICSAHGVCHGPNQCNCTTGYSGTFCSFPICNGVVSNNPSVCSGHGLCTAPGTCSCSSSSWTGADCQTPVCYGIAGSNITVCGSGGSCVSPDVCVCNSGYIGTKCEEYVCNGIRASNSSVCDQNGICTGPDSCTCYYGRSGVNCDNATYCFGHIFDSPSVCNGKGSCTGQDFCNCIAGYGGSSCQLPTCSGIVSSNSSVCSTHGTCTASNICTCTAGYTGTNCEYPVCFSTVSTSASVCSGHGSCLAANTCNCTTGYTGADCSLIICISRNSSDPDVCSNRGTCTSPDTCQCPVGYTGSECETAVCFGVAASLYPTVCSGRGICSEPDKCNCNAGYNGTNCEIPICFGRSASDPLVCNGGNNGTCVDRDNCTCLTPSCAPASCYGTLASNPSVCNGNGYCSSTDTCVCSPQYTGAQCTMSICNGIPSNNANVCNSRGNCSTPNNCICQSGYSGSDCEIINCFGTKSTSAAVCTGHGTCLSADSCSCYTGYTSNNCSMPLCFGKNASDSTVCNGHGYCLSADSCSCSSGYSGIDCSTIIGDCFGVSATSPLVCSGNGVCTAADTCNCLSGYTGIMCATPLCFGKNKSDALVCSGHGICQSADFCSCTAGYSGTNCQLTSCFTKYANDPQVCSGHGNCSSLNTCNCNTGYSGTDCQKYNCFGVLAASSSVCSGHGQCTAIDTCNCTSGYTGTSCSSFTCFGKYIYDVFVCSGHGVCQGVDSCACQTGYFGNDCATVASTISCFGISASSPLVCSGNGKCIATNTCDCPSGYSGVGCSVPVCFEKNSTDSTVCSSHGACIDADTCSCEIGYSGAECQTFKCYSRLPSDPKVCSGKGNCSAVNTCNCTHGYSGNDCSITNCFGRLSTDRVNVCSGHGACSAVDYCKCFAGYTGTNCSIPICNGRNATNPKVCSGNGICGSVNNCTCNTGHTGTNCELNICNGIKSSDVSIVCSGNGRCIGADTCHCYDGYFGVDCQFSSVTDTNTCSGDNGNTICSGHGNCDLNGNCTCEEGYSGEYCDLFGCFNTTDLTTCSGRGLCIGADICSCDDGYGGDSCSIILAPCSTDDTCGNGTCNILVGNCNCQPGYGGFNCTLWSCFNLPNYDPMVCSGNGHCDSPDVCLCHVSSSRSNCSVPAGGDNVGVGEDSDSPIAKRKSMTKHALIALLSLLSFLVVCCCLICLCICIWRLRRNGYRYQLGKDAISFEMYIPFGRRSIRYQSVVPGYDAVYSDETTSDLSDRSQSADPLLFQKLLDSKKQLTRNSSVMLVDLENRSWEVVNDNSSDGSMEPIHHIHAWEQDEVDEFVITYIEPEIEECLLGKYIDELDHCEVNMVMEEDVGSSAPVRAENVPTIPVFELKQKLLKLDPSKTEFIGLDALKEIVPTQKYQFVIVTKNSDGKPRASGGEKMDVSICPIPIATESTDSNNGQDPALTSITITDMHNGTYNVEFVVYKSGTYALKVDLESNTVATQPLLCIETVETSGPHIEIMGLTDLKEISAGEKYSFTMESKDQNGSILPIKDKILTVDLVSALKRKSIANTEVTNDTDTSNTVHATVTDMKDGKYIAEFVVEKAGPYHLKVELSSEPIASQIVMCKAKACPQNTEFNGLDSLQNIIAGETYNFTIISKDKFGTQCTSGGEPFKVTLQNPSDGTTIEATVIDNNDGTYTVEFVAEKPGSYNVDVSLNSENIIKQPIECKALADSKQSEVHGLESLNEITPDQKYQFTIISKDKLGHPLTHGGEPFKVTLDCEDGTSVEATVIDNNDGTYTVEFAAEKPGQYKVNVSLRSDNIVTQPVTCKAVVDPSKTEIIGLDSLNEVISGQKYQFTVITKDKNGDICPSEAVLAVVFKPKAEYTDPEKELSESTGQSPASPTVEHTPATVINNKDGTYTVEFVLERAGPYDMNATLDSSNITQKQVICKTLVDPITSEVIGLDSLKEIIASKKYQFTIVSKDKFGEIRSAGGDSFTVTLSNTMQPDASVTATVIDNTDGTYTVEFVADKTGMYDLNVSLDSKQTVASQEVVCKCESVVDDRVTDPKKTEIIGLDALKEFDAGQKCQISIISNDQYGTPRTSGGDNYTVALIAESNSNLLNANVVDLNDGTYSVNFVAEEPGKYELTVALESEIVTSEQVVCTPSKVDPSRCVVSSDQDYKKLKAGEFRKLRITAYDKQGNIIEKGGAVFSMNIVSKTTNQPVPSEFIKYTDLGDGTYDIEFTVQQASEYTMHMSLVDPDDGDTTELSGFPCGVSVSDTGVTDPQRTVLQGDGLTNTTVNKTCEFAIVTFDKFGNKRTAGGDDIRVSLTSKDLNIGVQANIVDEKNGTYIVQCTPCTPGLHQWNVTINGDELPKRDITVNNDHDAAARVIQRAYRNWKERCKSKADLEDAIRRNEAAIRIQRAYRGHLARKNGSEYEYGQHVEERDSDDDDYVIQSSDLARNNTPGEMKMLYQSFAKRVSRTVNRPVRALSLTDEQNPFRNKKSPHRTLLSQEQDNVIRLKSSGVSSLHKIAQKAMLQNKALDAVKNHDQRRNSFNDKPQYKHNFASAVMNAVGKDKEASIRQKFGSGAVQTNSGRKLGWVHEKPEQQTIENKPIVALPKYLDGLGFNMGYSIYKAKNKMLKAARKVKEQGYVEKNDENPN
jgi:hypothetical protein